MNSPQAAVHLDTWTLGHLDYQHASLMRAGWQSSSMGKEGTWLGFARYCHICHWVCDSPVWFSTGDIEDAVNQPADLLVRAEA